MLPIWRTPYATSPWPMSNATGFKPMSGDRIQRDEALEREKLQKQEVLEWEKLLKQEALERDKMQKQEAIELRQEAARVQIEAALREERVQADALAREELRVRSQAEADERNLARKKVQAEIKARNKQFKIQANNVLQHQKQDAEMKVQLAQMELMKKREIEFQQEKMREKDITAKEMEARLLLERQLAEEKRKTLRLEYEAKFRRHEIAESRRLAPIPEHESSLGLEQRGPAYTGIHQSYTTVYLRLAWHTPMGYLNRYQKYQKLPLSLLSQW